METHDRNLCASCLQEEYETFSHECVHESMRRNDEWFEQYRIDAWPEWEYSMPESTLTFYESGEAKVICHMQVVGTAQGDSWEWSWGNINLPERCKGRMLEVREFGAAKQWDQLTTLFLANDEYLGWECSSVASHVLNGIGAYRCPYRDEGDFVYLVILSAQFVDEQAIQ